MRILLALPAFLLAAFIAASAAAADNTASAVSEYPEKTIRIVLPLSPGGSADAIARMVADTFAGVFGQAVVVDNRPGANGIIGMDLVAKARAIGDLDRFICIAGVMKTARSMLMR